jgi:hypothetical protein
LPAGIFASALHAAIDEKTGKVAPCKNILDGSDGGGVEKILQRSACCGDGFGGC